MAADKTITINFVPKGDRKLIDAFQGLAKSQKKFNKTTQRVTNSTDKMGNAFSVMRSKLLLFNFAMALGLRQLIGFAKEAAKVKSMETAFTNMSGSVKGAEERLNALKSATNGTMTEFDLFQQANNAMILGLTRNTGEMANMFDAAQRLGRALGRDTKSSVESLVTGIGRQSRLMLDNIGIIVQTEKAYEKYAISLGKSASALTDVEKKQAFFNAAMEAAEQKLLILGAEIPTSQDALDAMAASFNEAGVNIGKAFLPVIESTALVMASLADSFDPERIKAYRAVLIGIGAAMAVYVVQLKNAVIWQTRLGWGALATGIGLVAAELLNMSGIFEDSEKPLVDARAKAVAYFEALKSKALPDLNKELEKQKAILTHLQDPLKTYKDNINNLENSMLEMESGSEMWKTTRDEINRLQQSMQDLVASGAVDEFASSEQAKKVAALIAEIQKYKDILGESGFTLNEFNTAQQKANELYNKTPEAQQAAIQSQIDFVKGLDESVISAEKLKEILEMLNLQLDKNANSSAKTASRVGKAFGQMSQAGVAFAKGNKDQTITALQLGKAQGLANIYVGATQAIKAKGWLGVLEGIAVIAAGMSTIANIDSQIAAVKATKAETGGLIGGRRHSSGGTMIEAEQGEFIMSRNAVNAVGVEAMNRINAGGGAGAVSINFSGNVMSQDFIEDEAIPMIKEAIRRGADIGVA